MDVAQRRSKRHAIGYAHALAHVAAEAGETGGGGEVGGVRWLFQQQQPMAGGATTERRAMGAQGCSSPGGASGKRMGRAAILADDEGECRGADADGVVERRVGIILGTARLRTPTATHPCACEPVSHTSGPLPVVKHCRAGREDIGCLAR